MAQRSNVPKFGNWESEENVPYTSYFENARKGKSGGKVRNPNDPKETDVVSNDTPVVQASPSRAGVEPEIPVRHQAVRSKHERQSSKDDGDLRQVGDSPSHHDTINRKATTDSSHQRYGDRGVSSVDTPKRATRQSGGHDRSVEQSPLHPHLQARVGGRGGGSGSGSGVSSPSRENKSFEGSHGLAPNTPGRSRLRSVALGDETTDKSAAVPKFGDWDESNPSSADGYTQIFNKVKEEKHGGLAKEPVRPTNSSYSDGHKQDNNDNSTMCFCFPWGKK